MTPPPALDVLRAGLRHPEALARFAAGRGPRDARRAAVLILFSHDEDAAALEEGDAAGLRLVVIEKSAMLRKHAGQVAFPGGSVEPDDGGAVQAALREAREEVGVDPESVEVLGLLPPAHISATGYDVRSVVGWWHRPLPLRPVDTVEVAAVHSLAVPALVDPVHRLTWTHPLGHVGPGFVVGDLFIWGFTGYLLDGLIRLAGWEQPWDARRRSAVPPRFLHWAARDTGL